MSSRACRLYGLSRRDVIKTSVGQPRLFTTPLILPFTPPCSSSS